MFRLLDGTPGPSVTIYFEGEPLTVPAGVSVAGALLLQGAGFSRVTPMSASRRGPFCLMGACFECLVDIDGQANQRGCQVAVKAGMRVRRQIGVRSVGDGE